MGGVRLHATNPLYWSGDGTTVTFVVETPLEFKLFKPGGRDRSKEPCRTCSTFDAYGLPAQVVTHARKAVHLRFDSRGDTIVAPDIYTQLLGVPGLIGPGLALEMVEEIKDPPPLFVGAVDKAKERILALPLNGHAPADKITPEQTKYQGEQRIWKPYVPVMDRERERLDRIETKKLRERRRIFTPKKKG
jgi:hypothetical protein